MTTQKYNAYQQYPIELWHDLPVRESALRNVTERMREIVARDGYSLLEEISRLVSFQKWVPKWTRTTRHWIFRKPCVPEEFDDDYGLVNVVRRGIFWYRTEHSEEGMYFPCDEEVASIVGVQLAWNTDKPLEP